jgi:hypothetical protein
MDITFQRALADTSAGDIIPNAGYHDHGDIVHTLWADAETIGERHHLSYLECLGIVTV